MTGCEVFFNPNLDFFPLGNKTVEEEHEQQEMGHPVGWEKFRLFDYCHLFSTTMGDFITFIFNTAAQIR